MSDQAKDHVTPPMAELATEMVEAAMAGQMAGLQVLLGEMQALAGVLPGLVPVPALTEAEAKAIDAAVEDSFDNMPI